MPKAYHKNPRTISEKQTDNLERDLVKYGDLSGIVHNLETDEVIGGNQRSKIMDFFRNNCEVVFTEQYDQPDEQGTVGLGYVIWKGKKYTYRQVRWDAKTAEGANIVANKAGGAWDLDILTGSFEVDDLLEWGFEREELGLEDVLPSALEDPGPQVDRAEELREKWQVESGQMWQLGEHRLICGDCTDAATVERVMGGEKAQAMVTDPPYAVFGSSTGVGNSIVDDKMIQPFCREVYRIFTETTPINGHGYICCDWKSFGAWWSQMERFPVRPLNCIVWDKGDGGLGSNYTNRHEFILFVNHESGNTKTMTGERVGTRSVLGVANVQRFNVTQGDERQHNAAKPPGLVSVFVQASTDPGDLVFEPFLGSGTTLIACEQLGRKCRAVEISPAYVAVALERWATATGKTPELVTNG